MLDALADDVELELEQRRVLHAAAAADEYLAEHRLAGTRRWPERGIVHRHVAPAKHDLALLAHDSFEKFFARGALAGVARQEHQTGAVLANHGKLHAEAFALARKERVWNLHQDAGAVAGVFLAAAGAADVAGS